LRVDTKEQPLERKREGDSLKRPLERTGEKKIQNGQRRKQVRGESIHRTLERPGGGRQLQMATGENR